MKVYKVQIYDVNRSFKKGKLYELDYALVKKTIFGVKEIVTNEPVATFVDPKKTGNILKYTLYGYKNLGYVIGCKKTDFKNKNLALRSDLKKYLYLYKHIEVSRIIERGKLAGNENNEKLKAKERKNVDRGLKKAKKLSKKLCY